MIDLAPDQLRAVRAILNERVPEREVWVFGSRATGKARPASDLDLAIMGEEPLRGTVLAELAEDFGDSLLPFRVAVVEWARLDRPFRNRLLENHHIIYSDKANS